MHHSIPGPEFANADEALQRYLTPESVVVAAVAFVSMSGARRLLELCGGLSEVSVAARAADATEPEALEFLASEGANVTVSIGKGSRGFHPKLWLIDQPRGGRLVVLSGSGNLTRGGLSSNVEQFEVFELSRTGAAAEEQWERMNLLRAATRPLVDVIDAPIWGEWLAVRAFAAKQPMQAEIEKRWEQLNHREVKLGREADRALLISDLFALYERTVAAKLPRADGNPYVPSRFLQAVRRAEAGEGDPVVLVRRICDHQTGGFDVIREHGGPELTVESLVLDASKPYHDLFGDRTRELSEARLKTFEG